MFTHSEKSVFSGSPRTVENGRTSDIDIYPLTTQSPVAVVTDNGETITLAESGAIVEFLIERYGGDKLAIPPTSSSMQDRADYLYWLHYAEGSAMLPSMLAMVFGRLPAQAPWFIRPILQGVSTGALDKMIIPRLKAQYGWIDKSLEGKDFFVGGKLTGADGQYHLLDKSSGFCHPDGRTLHAVMMSFVAEILDTAPIDSASYPNITRWHAAMLERPAYKAALEKGGENNMRRFVQK